MSSIGILELIVSAFTTNIKDKSIESRLKKMRIFVSKNNNLVHYVRTALNYKANNELFWRYSLISVYYDLNRRNTVELKIKKLQQIIDYF